MSAIDSAEIPTQEIIQNMMQGIKLSENDGPFEIVLDDHTVISGTFKNQQPIHIKIINNDKVTEIVFNEKNEIHGRIILNNKSYYFENGELK